MEDGNQTPNGSVSLNIEEDGAEMEEEVETEDRNEEQGLLQDASTGEDDEYGAGTPNEMQELGKVRVEAAKRAQFPEQEAKLSGLIETISCDYFSSALTMTTQWTTSKRMGVRNV